MRSTKVKSWLSIAISTVLFSVLISQISLAHGQPNDFSYSWSAVQGISETYNKQNYGQYRLPSNRDYYVFGESGRSGQNGRSGAAGRSGRDLTIQLNGENPTQNLQYNVSGQSGSDGGNAQPGEHARACRAPRRPEYSLRGANGGGGGNGGNGGDGGNGGNVSIFYSDSESLQNVIVNAAGGTGGQPGRGTSGGNGCDCIEPQWTVNYCEWELWRRPISTRNADWILYHRGLRACTGIREVDERENVPSVNVPDTRTYQYQLLYKGLVTSQHFFCQSGERGSSGRNGQIGRSGNYGKFFLIPQINIPEEIDRYTDSLKNLLDQSIELVKNIWVQRQGLSGLLHPSSDVPTNYTFLKSTERPQFRLEWAAEKTPEELGIEAIKVSATVQVESEQAKLSYEIPGTLDYTISNQGEMEVITVTGGFSPARLSQFELVNTTSGEAESELVLVDKGGRRELLQSTAIKVSCFTKQSASGVVTEDYQFRHSIDFEVTRGGLLNNRLAISGNEYTLTLGQIFAPWLQSGYDVKYSIEIHQKTNSGATYSGS
jgi:hypothetical protein